MNKNNETPTDSKTKLPLDPLNWPYSDMDFNENDRRQKMKIPESQGDQADQAQSQMDADLQEQIYQIRRRIKRP